MNDNNNTQSTLDTSKRHFFHPFTDFGQFGEQGPTQVITKAEGAYLYDSSGRRYLDAQAGIQCTNIGLGRKEIADAVAEQMTELTYSCNFSEVTNEPATALAAKVASLAPGSLNHVFFSTGGSMAVETAYRLIGFYQNVRGKPHKKHVLALRNAYHGSTYLTMSLGGKYADRGKCDYLAEYIHHLTCPHHHKEGKGLSEGEFLQVLEQEIQQKIAELGPENIAAFFMEPVLGAGGTIVPPEGYHQMVRTLCTEHGILMLCDEVVTGFGRLGQWFASSGVFGIQPDIITAAKGVTSAYLPLGMTIVSDEIFNACIDQGEYFNHGFTYSGHPVCCRAGLKNIEILEREGLLENARVNGAYFEQQVQKLYDASIVGEVRGMLFMQGIDFVADREANKPLPEGFDIATKITDACLARGLNLRCLPPATVLMTPPIILNRDEIDFIVNTLLDVCREVESSCEF